ncbi:Uncharacterized protein GBIM_20726 [Gryllus bimaculatus]|nr:Uncharacterized protein GBIM_20726 [Gryllus bimaculatus]
MQSFALLFKNRIEQLNMSTTDLTTIINVNAAFGMSLGLITGPLLKRYGYRKVALVGAFSSFIGITATSWASKFIDFLITYSLITSMGTFLLMSAFSLATNTYFRERRGYASGMSTTLTGLGPVVMPQVITFLLYYYGTTGTTMILGALSMHSVPAALLLQPVKWHMKTVIVPCDEDEKKEEEEKLLKQQDGKPSTGEPRRRSRRNTVNSGDQDDVDSYSLHGYETPIVIHRKFESNQQLNRRRKSSAFSRSISQNDDIPDDILQRRLSIIKNENCKSHDTVNLGSSVKIFDEKMYHLTANMDEINEKHRDERISKTPQPEESKISFRCDVECNMWNESDKEKPRSPVQRCWRFIVEFFDLDLLKDPGYVILMVGMSLAICAELNFSLFTPLILGDFGFSIRQIATLMSIIAFVDIIFRFLAPFIGDKLQFTAQNMYLLSLIMLITSRTSLMIFHDYVSAIIVACGLGVAKGFRTVYMALVIPSYVPLHRLASASGIQSVVNCVFIVLSIPLMDN